jgi:tRNA nucleotidyltransferase/poly(A) polymerase
MLNKTFAMKLEPETQLIVDRLVDAGVRPLLVGGCVRDEVLGLESKDVDIEMFGVKPDGSGLDFNYVKEIFAKDENFHIDEAGAEFSVLKVRVGNEEYDLALPRTEKSTGEGHTDYELQHDSTMSIEEAASRRDFTINSLMYDPYTKELIDPYGGAEDLKKGVLRHISPAFADDPLRCLRAVNFASRFDFDVDPETMKYCKDLAENYDALSLERVQGEFDKVFDKGVSVKRGLEVFHDIGWSKQMKPFENVSREEMSEIGRQVDLAPKSQRRSVLARAMHKLEHPDPTSTLTDVLKTRRKVKNTLSLMDAANTSSWGQIVASHRTLKTQNPEITNSELVTAFRITGDNDAVFHDLPEVPVPAVVTGKKLIDSGYKPGPEFGRIIAKAQGIQDEESIYDYDTLMKRSLS